MYIILYSRYQYFIILNILWVFSKSGKLHFSMDIVQYLPTAQYSILTSSESR